MPAPPFDLHQLGVIRARGEMPALPVFLTDIWKFEQRIREIGALAIRCSLDELPMTAALAGCDVILAFRDIDCEKGAAFGRHVRDNLRPRRLRVWADGTLSVMIYAH